MYPSIERLIVGSCAEILASTNHCPILVIAQSSFAVVFSSRCKKLLEIPKFGRGNGVFDDVSTDFLQNLLLGGSRRQVSFILVHYSHTQLALCDGRAFTSLPKLSLAVR